MNCPYCGHESVKGIAKVGGGLFDLIASGDFERLYFGKGEYVDKCEDQQTIMSSGDRRRAFLCPSCRAMIVAGPGVIVEESPDEGALERDKRILANQAIPCTQCGTILNPVTQEGVIPSEKEEWELHCAKCGAIVEPKP